MSSSSTIATPTTAVAGYTTSIAATNEQIRAAQRLRHNVFGNEYGAEFHTAGTDLEGFDVDELDAACDHLIVEHKPTGEVVGTYRLLPPGRREQLYSEAEFELGALDPIRATLVEAGRSCVHPQHRSGVVINQMWSALARYVLLSGHRYLAGCASVPLADGGGAAADTAQIVQRKHPSPARFRVWPHHPWLVPEPAAHPSQARIPALLRGYLRLGAWVCGPPAHDPDFGVADFFVLLQLNRIDERYLRYFLRESR